MKKSLSRMIAAFTAFLLLFASLPCGALAQTTSKEDGFGLDGLEPYYLDDDANEGRNGALALKYIVSDSIIKRIDAIRALPDQLALQNVFERGSQEITLKAAKQLATDKQYLVLESFDYVSYTTLTDIWRSTSKKSAKTYGVYLYGLYHISQLANIYVKTGDTSVADYMTKLLNNFLTFANNDANSNTPYLWHEFAVSTRSIVIAEYLSAIRQHSYEPPMFLYTKLLTHCKANLKTLLTSNFYKPYNHGLWQDMAVLTLARILGDIDVEAAVGKVIGKRLDEQIDTAFNDEGVNIENSFYYHYYNIDLFQKIQAFVVDNAFPLGDAIERIDEKLLLAKKVLNTMVRPDGYVPPVGDSSLFRAKLSYIPKTIIYRNTGLAFLKTADSMITVKAGFTNVNHKHDDDMSFTWYYKGHDVFYDGGKYNYDASDAYRRLFLSPLAHNTLGVSGRTYPVTVDGRVYSGFSKAVQRDKYVNIKMFLNVYSDIKLTRSLIWIKPNIIVLVDKGSSLQKRTYVQNFLMNPLETRSLTKTRAKLSGDGLSVDLRQWWSPDRSGSYIGDDVSARGWYSTMNDKKEQAYNVYFTRAGAEKRFATTITLKTGDKGERSIKSFKLTSTLATITMTDGEVLKLTI